MSEETKPPTTSDVVTEQDKGRCAPASGSALLPCPFCGAAPEVDTMRAYRAIDGSGNIGTGVAIYCVRCNADMMLCRKDLPEYDTSELLAMLTSNWNKRWKSKWAHLLCLNCGWTGTSADIEERFDGVEICPACNAKFNRVGGPAIIEDDIPMQPNNEVSEPARKPRT